VLPAVDPRKMPGDPRSSFAARKPPVADRPAFLDGPPIGFGTGRQPQPGGAGIEALVSGFARHAGFIRHRRYRTQPDRVRRNLKSMLTLLNSMGRNRTVVVPLSRR